MSDTPRAPHERAQLVLTAITFVAVVASAAAHRIGLPHRADLVFDVIAYIAGGWFAVGQTVPRLLRGHLDVDFLMVLAAIAAAATGHPHEGAILLFLFSLSNTLQAFAMDKSRRAIDGLLKHRPRQAVVLRDGVETVVALEEVAVGDLVLIRPGAFVPTDGVVRAGTTEMNEASITGESVPAEKGPGSPVYSGALNGTGAVEVEATRREQDSTLARIVALVESAQQHQAKTQRFLDTAEQIYARAIIAGVAVAILLPWLAWQEAFHTSFYRGMVLLVVASPCALVVSTPAAILSAIANGARHGILFKGGAYLELMSTVRAIVCDKTGTLTTGRPGVTDVWVSPGAPPGFTADDLLAYAAALESRSEHPLAREIIHAATTRGLALPAMTDFVTLPGRGVHATLDTFKVWLGADRLYAEHGETLPPPVAAEKARLESEGKSVLVLHRELERRDGRGTHEHTGGWLGLIAMADTLRPAVPEAVARFRELGVASVVMLTGDNRRVAAVIAAEAGVDEVHAGLLPEEKVRQIELLMQEHGSVMMIGDGVNDAPALATATVGVAMGAAGSDVALESAHCVLMGDDLRQVAYALDLSRRAVRTVWTNLTFSVAVIVVLITATLLGTLSLPLGVLGHEGSTLIVCANGLRLLRTPGRR